MDEHVTDNKKKKKKKHQVKLLQNDDDPAAAAAAAIDDDNTTTKPKKKQQDVAVAVADPDDEYNDDNDDEDDEYGRGVSVLPVYSPEKQSEMVVRRNLMDMYKGDPRVVYDRKMKDGGSEIKERARKRKYLSKVLEKKIEKRVESSMWKESHNLQGLKQSVETARKQLKAARAELLNEAERVVLEHEKERLKHAKQKAIKEIERKRVRRSIRFLLGLVLLVCSIIFLFISTSSVIQLTESFRNSFSNALKLKDPSDFIACPDIRGTVLDYTQWDSIGQVKEVCLAQGSVHEYYLYNITNPNQVESGNTVPIVDRIGPFTFQIGAEKKLISHKNGWVEIAYQPYYESLMENNENVLEQEIFLTNIGFQQAISKLSRLDKMLDQEVILITSVIVYHFNVHIKSKYSVDEWLEIKDGGVDCETFGCFLYYNNFERVYSLTSSIEEIDSYYSNNFDSLPIFADNPIDSQQAEIIWNMMTKDVFINDGTCALSSESLCKTMQPQVINLWILANAFRSLWTFDTDSPSILTPLDVVRLHLGKGEGNLFAFHDGIWSRNVRCKDATTKIGKLECTQINDLWQYFHWLFQKQWNHSLLSKRNTNKNMIIKKTIRQVLLTGYEDVWLAMYNLGIEKVTKMDVVGNETVDAEWYRHGWVKPVIEMPSKTEASKLFESYFSSKMMGGKQNLTTFWFPDRFLIDKSKTKHESIQYSPQTRKYMDGTNGNFRKSRYMGAIDDMISTTIFKQTTPIHGYDGAQLEPTLDLFWENQRFDENRQPYYENKIQNQWQNYFEYWYHIPFRPNYFTRVQDKYVAFNKESKRLDYDLSELDTSVHVNLQLVQYKLLFDRITRFNIDEGLPTCIVDISTNNNQIPFYVGYPYYLTCNSTHGETPSTADLLTKEERFDDQLDDGLTGGGQLEEVPKGELDPDIEEPLPIDERAIFQTEIGKEDNKTMNVFVLEPITGTIMYSNIALGIYIQPELSSYLFKGVLTFRARIPHYSMNYSFTRDIKQAQALGGIISSLKLKIRALAYSSNLISIITAGVGLFFWYTLRFRPELVWVQVKPIEKLEKEAKKQADDLILPIKQKLEEKKKEYEIRLQEYENTKAKLIAEETEEDRGIDLLYEEEHDLAINKNKRKKKRKKKSKEKLCDAYGIGRDGKVFKFSREELHLLLTNYGVDIENVDDEDNNNNNNMLK